MFKRVSLLLLCCIASLTIVAQNTRLVKGVVFSDQEIPLKGATITLVGMPGSTQTDENGLFEFSVSPYAKQVEASCEGYFSKKAEIDGTYLIFKLKVDKKYAQRKAKEEEEARKAAQKEAEAKAKAEEQARIAAQKEAEAKAKAEEQARIAAQKEAEAKAKAEEQARIAAQKEAEAKAKAEEEARLAAEKRAKQEAEAKARAEEQARIAAQKEAETQARTEEVAPIATEKAKRNSDAKIAAEKRSNKDVQQHSGFASIIDVSYGLPIDFSTFSLATAYSDNISLSYTAGYRISNTLFVGAGVGINYNLHTWAPTLTLNNAQGTPLKPAQIGIPVFAYFRVNFLNTQCSPFFALAAGYEISDKQELALELVKVKYNTGGFFVNPQIGLNIRTSLSTALYLAVGVKGFSMPYCVEHTGYNATLKPTLGCAIDFHLGFSF